MQMGGLTLGEQVFLPELKLLRDSLRSRDTESSKVRDQHSCDALRLFWPQDAVYARVSELVCQLAR